jgi:hypothetical protein
MLARGVAVLSGATSIGLQLWGLYSGKPITRPIYLFAIWAAFSVSAFLAWLQEHRNIEMERNAKEKAEKALADTSPRLFLEFSKEHANDFTMYSGLFVRNSGVKPAFKIELSAPKINGLGLAFEKMPIERIDPAKRIFVDLRCGHEDKDRIFRPTGGGLGVQLDALFDRLSDDGKDESYPIDIKYRGYDGNEFLTPCVINRTSNFVENRIWCELIHAPR